MDPLIPALIGELAFAAVVVRVLYRLTLVGYRAPLRTPEVLDGPITTDTDYAGMI